MHIFFLLFQPHTTRQTIIIKPPPLPLLAPLESFAFGGGGGSRVAV